MTELGVAVIGIGVLFAGVVLALRLVGIVFD